MSDVQTYGERRAYAVPDRLADLTGPASGHVVLPPELGWTGRTDYDPASVERGRPLPRPHAALEHDRIEPGIAQSGG